MRKTYIYDKTFELGDDDVAHMVVEFISDGNTGQTSINVPGPRDPVIANSGAKPLGTGQQLKTVRSFCVSEIANPVPEETDITVEYRIRLNDEEEEKLLLRHSKPKTEADQQFIILIITFTGC